MECSAKVIAILHGLDPISFAPGQKLDGTFSYSPALIKAMAQFEFSGLDGQDQEKYIKFVLEGGKPPYEQPLSDFLYRKKRMLTEEENPLNSRLAEFSTHMLTFVNKLKPWPQTQLQPQPQQQQGQEEQEAGEEDDNDVHMQDAAEQMEEEEQPSAQEYDDGDDIDEGDDQHNSSRKRSREQLSSDAAAASSATTAGTKRRKSNTGNVSLILTQDEEHEEDPS